MRNGYKAEDSKTDDIFAFHLTDFMLHWKIQARAQVIDMQGAGLPGCPALWTINSRGEAYSICAFSSSGLIISFNTCLYCGPPFFRVLIYSIKICVSG